MGSKDQFYYKGLNIDLVTGTIYHTIDGKPFYFMYIPKDQNLAKRFIDENIDLIKNQYHLEHPSYQNP